VSALTAAARDLFGNPNPSASIHARPMQHPVATPLLWLFALIAVFAPLATALYRRGPRSEPLWVFAEPL
jgi:hypothetical protein